jgi:hypothetical protein
MIMPHLNGITQDPRVLNGTKSADYAPSWKCYGTSLIDSGMMTESQGECHEDKSDGAQ